MGASSEYPHLHKGRPWQLLHDLVVALAVLAFREPVNGASNLVLGIGIDLIHYLLRPLFGKASLDYVLLLLDWHEQLAVVPVPCKEALYVILMLWNDAVTERIVVLFYLSVLELGTQRSMGLGVEGYDHHTACILVQSMDDTWSRYIALVSHGVYEILSVAVCQCIHYGSIYVSSTWMNHHPLSLVYHKHRAVFVQHIKRYVLRLDLLKDIGYIGKGHDVAFLYSVALLGGPAIYGHGAHWVGQGGSGEAFYAGSEVGIHALLQNPLLHCEFVVSFNSHLQLLLCSL